MAKPEISHWSPVSDLAELRLGDKRREARARRVVQRAVAAPGDSFPEMLFNEAELEGFYRLVNNAHVSLSTLLAPHLAATAARARASSGPVLIAHDTTVCSFGGEGERAGVGTIANDGTGLAVHAALALRFDGLPFGLLDLQTHTRLGKVSKAARPPAQRESARWTAGVRAAGARVGTGPQIIHVMDREADTYLVLDALVAGGHAFVVRASQMQRRIVDETATALSDAVDTITATGTRTVPLARRSDYRRKEGAKRKHPAREARDANLAIGARPVTLNVVKGQRQYAKHATLTVNLVRVWEPTPPDGEPAVEWCLFTTLPIATPDDLFFIIDCYRRRWLVEEYFKALKTGCEIEKRQLESRHALEAALALLAPVAAHLLLLRSLARTTPDAPATTVLTRVQLEVLCAIARTKLAPTATAREALLAIAGLGGFLKRNGEPGWQILGRGHERLLEAVVGWKAAKGLAGTDQ